MKTINLIKVALTGVCCFMLGNKFAFATGDIRGYVTDSASAAPLEFATVLIEAGDFHRSAYTDENGLYIIKPLDAGTYTLRVSYSGRRISVITNVVINDGKTKYLNVKLSSNNILKEFVFKEDSNGPLVTPFGPIRSIGASQLENMAGAKQPKDVIALTPGVTQSDNGGELYFRGSRSGSTRFYIDGEKMMGQDIDVAGSAISDMTIYTGGIPAQYGDCTGGVVVITTKSYATEIARRKIKYGSGDE